MDEVIALCQVYLLMQKVKKIKKLEWDLGALTMLFSKTHICIIYSTVLA